MTRLSHSAIQKYLECPRRYYLHYVEKLREEVVGSPLFFGGAIDEALNELLKTKMPTNKEPILDPEDVFWEHMTKIEYNREEIELPQTLKTRYSFSDYDPDLFDEEDIELLQKHLENEGYENTNPLEVMDNLIKFIKAHSFVDLDETDKIFYNICCWKSLINKGLMMIDTYRKELLPQIEEVISIQKEVTLPNEDGDIITGYIDFTAKLKDDDKIRLFTCDNKTSSKKYKENAVQESPQLCIYSEFEDNDYGSFFVMNKKVRKTVHKTCLKCGAETTRAVKKCAEGGTGKNRCNGEFKTKTICSIDTQIIKDKITEEFKDETFETIENVLYNIRDENFPRIDKKDCFFFGKHCCYHSRCFGKDSNCMEGLVKLEKRDE